MVSICIDKDNIILYNRDKKNGIEIEHYVEKILGVSTDGFKLTYEDGTDICLFTEPVSNVIYITDTGGIALRDSATQKLTEMKNIIGEDKFREIFNLIAKSNLDLNDLRDILMTEIKLNPNNRHLLLILKKMKKKYSKMKKQERYEKIFDEMIPYIDCFSIISYISGKITYEDFSKYILDGILLHPEAPAKFRNEERMTYGQFSGELN